MDKKLSLISWIKNRIFSIIYRLKGKTENRISEDLKHLIVREKELEENSGEKKKIAPSIGEDIKQLIDREKKLEESRAAILNTISEGITGLEEEYDKRLEGLERSREAILNKLLDGITGLEGEYDKRFKGLEVSIDELRKEKVERPAFDFISSKEDFKRIIDAAKIVSSIPEENLEMIANITIKKSEIEDLREKIENVRETASELKEDNMGLYTRKNASEEEKKIGEIMKTIIEKVKEYGEDTTEDLLEKSILTIRLATLLSEEKIEPLKTPINRNNNIKLNEFLEGVLSRIHTELKPFKIESLYPKGIDLLRKRAYKEAKVYFTEITTIDPNLKGAWLNGGVASGGLGDIEEEIACYNMALRIDENYKKASHNNKIAKRKMKRTTRGE